MAGVRGGAAGRRNQRNPAGTGEEAPKVSASRPAELQIFTMIVWTGIPKGLGERY